MKYIISILLLILAISCEDPIDNTSGIDTLSTGEHFLWPLELGNYWGYTSYDFRGRYDEIEICNFDTSWAYEGFHSFGVTLDSIPIEPYMYRYEVVGEEYIRIGDTVYVCHILDTYNFTSDEYTNFNTPFWAGDDGLYNMGIYGGGDTILSKGLYIPSNIELDSPWGGQFPYKQHGFFHASTVVDRRCLSKTELLTTPIGNFECYVIFTRIWQAEDIAGWFDYYEYYSPGVGRVCLIRLSVSPVLGPNSYGAWWLDYLSVINEIQIN